MMKGFKVRWNRASNLPSWKLGLRLSPREGALKACGLLQLWDPSLLATVGVGRQGEGHTES